MGSTTRAIRRNIVRHNANAMGLPFRDLWRAHQKAKANYIQRRTQTWWNRHGFHVCIVVLLAATIAYLLLTISIGKG